MPPSAEYGEGEQLRRAQQAIPMAAAPPVPNPAPGATAPPEQRIWAHVEDTPTLGNPTSRPDEPITAGMSFGPGRTPSPGQRPRDFASDDIVDRLRAVYLQYPTQELAELLDQSWL